MPAGTYEHRGDGGRVRLVERFRCAAEGSGWRYTSRLFTPDGADAGAVDVTVDLTGRPLRVAVDIGGWSLRGGRSGPDLLWVRRPVERAAGGADPVEHRERAHGFCGISPAFLVAAAAAVPRTGQRLPLRLVSLSDALATVRSDQRWRLTGVRSQPAGGAALEVSAYDVVDVDTGDRRTVHIAGDVVLAAPGIGLTGLDSPPGSPLSAAQ